MPDFAKATKVYLLLTFKIFFALKQNPFIQAASMHIVLFSTQITSNVAVIFHLECESIVNWQLQAVSLFIQYSFFKGYDKL